MSRRTQPCEWCSGRTRHDDRACSACRRIPEPVRRSRRALRSLDTRDHRIDALLMAWQAYARYAIAIPRRHGHAFVVGSEA